LESYPVQQYHKPRELKGIYVNTAEWVNDCIDDELIEKFIKEKTGEDRCAPQKRELE
jgi:hypothetical protein